MTAPAAVLSETARSNVNRKQLAAVHSENNLLPNLSATLQYSVPACYQTGRFYNCLFWGELAGNENIRPQSWDTLLFSKDRELCGWPIIAIRQVTDPWQAVTWPANQKESRAAYACRS